MVDHYDFPIRSIFKNLPIDNDFACKYPKLRFVARNDGTGSGKTKNVINRFINVFGNREFLEEERDAVNCFIYTTPTKKQLIFPDECKRAIHKNIPVFQYRSKKDRTNLKVVDCIYTGKRFETFRVRDVLKEFSNNIKEAFRDKGQYIKKLSKKLQISKQKQDKDKNKSNDENLLKIIDNIRNLIENYLRTFDIIENMKAKNSNADYSMLDKELSSLAKALAHKMDYLVSYVLLNASDAQVKDMVLKGISHEKAIYDTRVPHEGPHIGEYCLFELISYTTPWDFIQYVDSIILMTTDKSFHSVTFYRNGPPSSTGQREAMVYNTLFSAVGGRKKDNPIQLIEAINQDGDVYDAVEKSYLAKDVNSPVFNACNAINFTTAFDEVHEMPNKAMENKARHNISGKNPDNIIHIMASIFRLASEERCLEHKTRGLKKEKSKFEVQRKKFRDNFLENISKTVLINSPDIDPEIVLNSLREFSMNTDGLLIEKCDTDSIQSVCNNSFTLSSRFSASDDKMKAIKIKANYNDRKAYIEYNLKYSDTDWMNSDHSMNMLDLIHILNCAIKAALVAFNSEFPKEVMRLDENPAKTKKPEYLYSQNDPLYHFLVYIMKNKEELLPMLEDCNLMDGETCLDSVLVYFLTKTIFKVTVREEVKYKRNDNFYVADIQLSMVGKLLEVYFMQMLANERATVIVMSATSGFAKRYSSDLCREFFTEMNENIAGCNIPRLTGPDTEEKEELNKFTIDRSKNKSLAICNVKSIYTPEGNKPGTIEYETYKANDLSSFNLQKHTVISEAKSMIYYSDMKNQIAKKLMNHLKPSVKFNFHRQHQLDNIISSILLSIQSERHSLILSNSHYMHGHLFSNEGFNLYGNTNIKRQGIVIEKVGGKCPSKVLDIRFQLDGGKPYEFYLVFLDASTSNSDEFTQIMSNGKGKQVIIVSSYGGGGTALNLLVKGEDNKEYDMQDLYLCSLPFYNEQLIKNYGYNHIDNFILNAKQYAHNRNKKLKDLDVLDYDIIKREYMLSQAGTLMQAIGRLERTNEGGESRVFVMSTRTGKRSDLNNWEQFMICFVNLYKNEKRYAEDDGVLHTLSLFNKTAVLVAQSYLSKIVLEEDVRNNLKAISEKSYNEIHNKLLGSHGPYREFLYGFREDGSYPWFREFNDKLRSVVSLPTLKSFQTYLLDLGALDSFTQKEKAFFKIFHDYMILKRPENKRLTLVKMSNSAWWYSDMSECSPTIVNNEFFFGIGNMNPIYNSRNNNSDGLSEFEMRENQCIKSIQEMYEHNIEESNEIKNIIMSPGLINVVSGNIGEAIFRKVLSSFDLLDFLLDVSNDEELRCIYELYDTYLYRAPTEGKKGLLIAIDVKHWRLRSDKNLESTSRFESKYNQLKRHPRFQNCDIKALYVNTYPSDSDKHYKLELYIRNSVRNNPCISYMPLMSTLRDVGGDINRINLTRIVEVLEQIKE